MSAYPCICFLTASLFTENVRKNIDRESNVITGAKQRSLIAHAIYSKWQLLTKGCERKTCKYLIVAYLKELYLVHIKSSNVAGGKCLIVVYGISTKNGAKRRKARATMSQSKYRIRSISPRGRVKTRRRSQIIGSLSNDDDDDAEDVA